MGLEEWRDIPDFEGQYQVSNRGQVKSLPRTLVNRNGVVSNLKGRILLPLKDRYGHLSVMLTAKYKRSIHRIVANAFIPNPNGYPLVRHIDGNPANNEVSNLAWGTQKQNMADRRLHGTDPYLNRTHCPYGHEYNEENTYHWGNHRKCRTCMRLRAREKSAKSRVDTRPPTA